MEQHRFFLEKLVAEHWVSVQSAMGTIAISLISAVLYLLRKGGKPAILKWHEDLDRETRAGVHAKITGSLSSIASSKSQPTACDDLIAGLDQWRALQEQYKARAKKIRRAPLIVVLIFIGIGGQWVLGQLLETSDHMYSACTVGCVLLLTSIAILVDWLPLMFLSYQRGMIPEKAEAAENKKSDASAES